MYAWRGAVTIGVLRYGTAEVAVSAPDAGAVLVAIVSIMLLSAAIYGLAWWRSYRSRVEADSRGAVVRNVIRSHHVAWEEVSELTWEPHAYYRRTGIVNLRDGRRIRA
jgi:hypothetical protein